jgi:hypothetical protein
MKLTIPMVLNTGYGGFQLSEAIVKCLQKDQWEHFDWLELYNGRWMTLDEKRDELRRDPMLISVVRRIEAELAQRTPGSEASKHFLKVLGGLRYGEVEVSIDIGDDDGKEFMEISGNWRPNGFC